MKVIEYKMKFEIKWEIIVTKNEIIHLVKIFITQTVPSTDQFFVSCKC